MEIRKYLYKFSLDRYEYFVGIGLFCRLLFKKKITSFNTEDYCQVSIEEYRNAERIRGIWNGNI